VITCKLELRLRSDVDKSMLHCTLAIFLFGNSVLQAWSLADHKGLSAVLSQLHKLSFPRILVHLDNRPISALCATVQ